MKSNSSEFLQNCDCFPGKGFSQNDEINQLLETATNRNKICEELEQRLDLVTKRHDELTLKARNFVGSKEEARSVSSRSGKRAFRKFLKKPEVHISLGPQFIPIRHQFIAIREEN